MIQWIFFLLLMAMAMTPFPERVEEVLTVLFISICLWYIPLWIKGLLTLIKDVDRGYDSWKVSLAAVIYLLALLMPGLWFSMVLK